MFFMSEKKYNIKLSKIKKRNESKKRTYLLKEEKRKIKQLTKSKMKTSNIVLVAAIMAVILFSITCLYIQYKTGYEINSTLITAWYSFWTVEIVSLAGIKVSKVFKNSDTESKDLVIDDTNDAVG